MPVDNRSPEQAYTTKDNILVPRLSEYGATAGHLTATVERAAQKSRLSVEPQPSVQSGATNTQTITHATKGTG